MTADEVDVETGGEGEVAVEETETVEEEEEVMSLTGIGRPFEKFQCPIRFLFILLFPAQTNNSETSWACPRTTAKAWSQVVHKT